VSDIASAVAELAALIERVSGNVIPPGHHPFLAETARQRAASLRLAGVPEYVRALAEGSIPGEWSSLLPHVTIKESFLFRHPQQFSAFARTVLPQVAAARSEQRTLRVWSAGCARGEEPATLAIVLAGCKEIAGWEWRILATDVDEQALAAARAGLFAERAVSHVPRELRSLHFTPRGDLFELSSEIARRIEFRMLNLMQEPLFGEDARFDVIFLRNVLIYFRPEAQRRVAAAVAHALAPDGVLFLGPAETLWQLSGDLDPIDLGECFCYRLALRPHGGPWTVDRGQVPAQTTPRALSDGGPTRTVGSRALLGRDTGAPRPRLAGSPAPTSDHGPGATHSAPPGTRGRLADAVRSLAEDRLDRAADLVDQALLADPSDPAAHALEGLLHEFSGRAQLAVASYRASLFLDPALFQVRLLLADALRRLGHGPRAVLEYREVMASLAAGTARGLDALAGLAAPAGGDAAQRCRDALLALQA